MEPIVYEESPLADYLKGAQLVLFFFFSKSLFPP